jgi:hypothetical protein
MTGMERFFRFRAVKVPGGRFLRIPIVIAAVFAIKASAMNAVSAMPALWICSSEIKESHSTSSTFICGLWNRTIATITRALRNTQAIPDAKAE